MIVNVIYTLFISQCSELEKTQKKIHHAYHNWNDTKNMSVFKHFDTLHIRNSQPMLFLLSLPWVYALHKIIAFFHSIIIKNYGIQNL